MFLPIQVGRNRGCANRSLPCALGQLVFIKMCVWLFVSVESLVTWFPKAVFHFHSKSFFCGRCSCVLVGPCVDGPFCLYSNHVLHLTQAYLSVRITRLLHLHWRGFVNISLPAHPHVALRARAHTHTHTHTMCFWIPKCLRSLWDSYF